MAAKFPKLNFRAILLGFFLVLLSLPGLNMLLKIVESANLTGGIIYAQDTSFNTEGWIEGGYQHQKEKYLNDYIGFRPDLVRINNQLDYSLFNKLHANGVVVGKNNYLYEDGYINAYYGKDYLGDERIASLMRKVKFIQDTMARAGKALVFAFVPSKGRFYPEYFPNDMVQAPTSRSNYLKMKNAGEALGVHIVDLNGWFCNMKARAPHPLFSKLGIHWTHWGADRAADSLNRYLEKLLHIDIPEINFGELECSSEPRGENDIATGLNLIWPIVSEELCYDHVSFNEDSATKQKPSVIFICDSFFWTLISNGIPQHCYHNWEDWYYYNEIWDEKSISGKGELRYVSKIDRMETIRLHDAMILFVTEINLPSYKDNFIDEAYTLFGGK